MASFPFLNGREKSPLPSVIRQDAEHKGICHIFSRPSRKGGAVPLVTYMHIYKTGDIVDVKGMGTVRKEMPHKCDHGNTGRVYTVTQHAVGTVRNTSGQDSCQENNVHIEHIKRSERRDCFLKWVKENDQEKKEAKEEGT